MPSAVRKSVNSRRRALVLLTVHLLIAAHATHYLVARRTLSPVEPSEAMYTLELGRVNAGFVFLLVALLATFVFGRFVCGWGCHLVALQDLCGWLMKKAGIRPRPFRSRLLAWLPAALAFYMFAWPAASRVARTLAARNGWLDAAPPPFPGFSGHLTTTAFWATFPGPLLAVLTLAICGFAAVYFLGAKGFCSYGCPYGALFGGAARLAPGNIVASDACEQCGHCTATCTSNVLVHEEVRLYRQVVDPGCMKCMDCVSVCPKGALSFGFAAPSMFKKAPPGARRTRRYGLGLGRELFVAVVAVVASLAFRGLYDGPPLLMAVGLGGISAFVALKLWQLLRDPTVKLQNLTLKAGGRTTRAGWPFAVVSIAWMLFASHSAAVQWERARGRSALDRTEASREEALDGAALRKTFSQAHARAVERAHRHFSRADRWGLIDVREVELGLAWTHLLRDEPGEAERRLRAAIALAPGEAALHDHLADFLLARGRGAEAVAALEERMRATGAAAPDPLAVRRPDPLPIPVRAVGELANGAVVLNDHEVLRKPGRREQQRLAVRGEGDSRAHLKGADRNGLGRPREVTGRVDRGPQDGVSRVAVDEYELAVVGRDREPARPTRWDRQRLGLVQRAAGRGIHTHAPQIERSSARAREK